MNDIYMIIAAISVIAVAFGLVFALFFTDRDKNTEGENCSYDPNVKERPCCKKIAEIAAKSTID